MSISPDPLLVNVALYLGATVVAVPIFKRLGFGSVLGYLAAGAVVGPFGLGFFGNVEEVRHIAEFGVVLLLFVIGLELQPSRLWRLRAEIFGLGFAQVALSGLGLAAGCVVVGIDWPAAAVIGLALALSSTAFGVQILRDKGALASPYGDRAFSILLFQDIAVVPLLALTAFLGGQSGGMSWEEAAIALGALAGLIIVGHYGLSHLFRLIAIIKAYEIFNAAALLVVALAALVMQWVGLSMALGAFIAGVLLAETEFRHQLESDIEPFRTLFLGLFFVGVGMSVDWFLAAEWWWAVIGGALALFAIKMSALYALARAAGSGRGDALRIASTLGQAGEFGFVVFALAANDGLISGQQEALLTISVAISMALTPLVVKAEEWALERAASKRDEHGEFADVADSAPASIIVAGFGRSGQVIARIMRLRGYSVTLIDNSPRRIRLARGFGSEVFYGDATKLDVMMAAGAHMADAIFYCINDREGAQKAAKRLNERFPDSLILFMTYDRFSEVELRKAGADIVIRETLQSAVSLAKEGLIRLGDGDMVDEIIEEFDRRDEELIRLQMEHGMEEGADKMRQRYSID
ncbi:MAG: monovalent cation:proton antiporter-2 (CPA2) family protein [Pikeienuella sp.]